MDTLALNLLLISLIYLGGLLVMGLYERPELTASFRAYLVSIRQQCVRRLRKAGLFFPLNFLKDEHSQQK
jgi:hypothetical protein